MRPNKIASLEALAESAKETAETFEAAAEWASTQSCRALFYQLSRQRREMAHVFERRIKEQGASPKLGENSDDASQRLMSLVRTTLVSQRPRALIDECERAESAFAHILSTDQPYADEEEGRLIAKFHADVIAALGLLAAAKVRMRHFGL